MANSRISERATTRTGSVRRQGQHSALDQHSVFWKVDEATWRRLPSWACFWTDLGYAVASNETLGIRNVVAAAAPTRAFASVLAAWGVAKALSASINDESSLEHLELLRSLESGTPVTVRVKNQRYRGTLVEVPSAAPMDDGGSIRVQLGPTDFRSITVHQALRVQVDTGPRSGGNDRVIRRRILPNPEFCARLCPGVDPCHRASVPRLESLILGRSTLVASEVCDFRLAVRRGKGVFEEGTFQDILRVRRFLSEGQPHASEVAPVTSGREPEISNGMRPKVVIFDGALGFLKWRDLWRDAHWIVILDRHEPSFPAAVDELNGEYVTRRSEETSPPRLPVAPRGVEVAAHREELP